MAITKWRKDDIFPSLDSVWDDFFSRDFFSKGIDLGTSIPAVNVKETEQSFNLEVAVPGFNKEDFDIQIENGMITISSEKEEKKEEKDGEMVTRSEFNYSSFERSFQLPENVKEEDISAEYKDGLLRLEIPKDEQPKLENKKRIEVK